MSRDLILSRIRAGKPANQDLPEIPAFAFPFPLADRFREFLEKSGGRLLEMKRDWSLAEFMANTFPEAKTIFSPETEWGIGNLPVDSIKGAADCDQLDLAVLRARLGVAENGAVWLSEAEMGFRFIPFIAEHLVVVLDAADLVANMHEAYQRVQIDETGFGVFIGGPSKTADIEQALVIGAQGPRAMTVVLVKE